MYTLMFKLFAFLVSLIKKYIGKFPINFSEALLPLPETESFGLTTQHSDSRLFREMVLAFFQLSATDFAELSIPIMKRQTTSRTSVLYLVSRFE